MTRKERRIENLCCLLAGLLFAIAYIAVVLGDGNKGLLDLF